MSGNASGNYDRVRGGVIFDEFSELSQVLMTMAVSGLSELYGSTRGGGTAPLSHRGQFVLKVMRGLAALFLKDLNLDFLGDHVGESVGIAGRSDHVIVDPVVVASTGLAHQERMVPESLLIEPRLGYLPVEFCPGCEEAYPMTGVIPRVDRPNRVWECFGGDHSLRLFIGDVLAHGPVDIDQIVLDPVLEGGANSISFLGC